MLPNVSVVVKIYLLTVRCKGCFCVNIFELLLFCSWQRSTKYGSYNNNLFCISVCLMIQENEKNRYNMLCYFCKQGNPNKNFWSIMCEICCGTFQEEMERARPCTSSNCVTPVWTSCWCCYTTTTRPLSTHSQYPLSQNLPEFRQFVIK